MEETKGTTPKETKRWPDWEPSKVTDGSGNTFSGFLRIRELSRSGFKNIIGQFCYQPEGNAKVTGVEPHLVYLPKANTAKLEIRYTGSTINVEHEDGKKQAIYIPSMLLRHEDGKGFSINNTTNFFAIDGGKTPSND